MEKHKSQNPDLVIVRHKFSVEEMVVFPGGGALAHLGHFWEAVVAQSLVLDQAHAVSVRNWAEASFDERDPEFAIEASYREEVLRHSDHYLLRANIYALLLAFFEFAMLEVYKLKFGGSPDAQRPKLKEHILDPLTAEGVITADFPSEYVQGVSAHRDAIRNDFAHGRWAGLKDATSGIELYDVFHSICGYLSCVAEKLREQGLNP